MRLATQAVAGRRRRRRARTRRGRPLRGCPRACRRSRGDPRRNPRGRGDIPLGAFSSRAFRGPRDLPRELSLELRLEVAQRLPFAGVHRVPRARPRRPEGCLHRAERSGSARRIRPLFNVESARRVEVFRLRLFLPPAGGKSPRPRSRRHFEARRLVVAARPALPFRRRSARTYGVRTRQTSAAESPDRARTSPDSSERIRARRKRCPSARKPRSRRGTPTRSTTASMTTTEGYVRPRPAWRGEGSGRATDPSAAGERNRERSSSIHPARDQIRTITSRPDFPFPRKPTLLRSSARSASRRVLPTARSRCSTSPASSRRSSRT